MDGEQAKRYYHLAMILLNDLLKSQRRLEGRLSQAMDEQGEYGMVDTVEVGRLRRRIRDVDAEISATIELVNQYADQVGPRTMGQLSTLARS